MLIKWIFNLLLLIWLYTMLVRPLLQGYFGASKRPGGSDRAHEDAPGKISILPKRKATRKDDDEYIDYEEVK